MESRKGGREEKDRHTDRQIQSESWRDRHTDKDRQKAPHPHTPLSRSVDIVIIITIMLTFQTPPRVGPPRERDRQRGKDRETERQLQRRRNRDRQTERRAEIQRENKIREYYSRIK